MGTKLLTKFIVGNKKTLLYCLGYVKGNEWRDKVFKLLIL